VPGAVAGLSGSVEGAVAGPSGSADAGCRFGTAVSVNVGLRFEWSAWAWPRQWRGDPPQRGDPRHGSIDDE